LRYRAITFQLMSSSFDLKIVNPTPIVLSSMETIPPDAEGVEDLQQKFFSIEVERLEVETVYPQPHRPLGDGTIRVGGGSSVYLSYPFGV
jgi:hypothetical protein